MVEHARGCSQAGLLPSGAVTLFLRMGYPLKDLTILLFDDSRVAEGYISWRNLDTFLAVYGCPIWREAVVEAMLAVYSEL
jgi:hypothetical protein